jgi:hypothetical protein
VLLDEKKLRDILFPARKKENLFFQICLVVCIGFGNARMGQKKF